MKHILFTLFLGALTGSLGILADHQDIGITPEKGNTVFDSAQSMYRITGGGANIWSKVDAFQFAYLKLSGDATLTADVHFEGQGVEQHRKAALMFRQGLEPDSAYVDVALHGDGLTSLQYRPTSGADTLETRSEVKAPMQIRIERHTDQFTIAAGTPGQPLTSTGPVTVHLADPVYLGLAVCSHNASVLETAVFSNVHLESNGTRAASAAPRSSTVQPGK